MRNSFHTEDTETTQTRTRFSESEYPTHSQETQQPLTVKAATTADSQIWHDAKREMLWQNLFGPRQYCRWMALATIVLTVFKLPYTYIGRFPTMNNNMVPTGGEIAMGVLPFLCWGIAFILFYTGAMTPALHDSKVAELLNPTKEDTLPEEVIKQSAVHNREYARLSAHRGTLFLWLGILATISAPVIVEWLRTLS
jgi:hypothetical protein